ncbi:SPOR domain-containing protein [Rhizobium sp. SGZ-381]|uniref:SPOR domain-containing protein n=1 Tax=Rhizobium sp. SGZ-381 TaxID=3342800 RepID=UPI00366C7ED8
MADNSVALGRGSGPDLFADDDPLAELARIAGYDDRPSQRQPSSPRSSARPISSPRQEPAFNLEDELLREFESYESPRLDPVDDLALDATVRAASGNLPQEPHFAAPEAGDRHRVYAPQAHSAEMRGVDPFADDLDAGAVPTQSLAPASPAFDVQGRVDDFGGFGRREPFEVAEPAVEPGFGGVDPFHFQAESRRAEPVRALPEPSVPQPVMDESFQLDLISELETSLVAAPAPVARKASSRPPAKAYEPGFRMPLANFNRAPERTVEPVMAAEPRLQPQYREESPVAPVAEAPAARRAPDADSIVDVARSAPHLDALDTFETPLLTDHDLATDFTDVRAAASDARVADKGCFQPLEEPVYDVDHYASRSSRTEAPVEPDLFRRGGDVSPAPVSKADPAPLELLNEDDFELSLEELELDFSDILAAEPRFSAPQGKPAAELPRQTVAEKGEAPLAEPVARPAADAAAAAPAASTAAVNPFAARPASSAATVSPVVPAFLASSRSAAAMSQEPMADQPVVATPAAVPDFAPDAFDPALFADTEEMLESVPDLNVPDLPAHEPEQRPVPHSDFDLHLDSELASLFEAPAPAAPVAQEPARSRATPTTAPSIAAVAPAPQTPATANEFDDFERALEEDFRRTLLQPIQPGRSVGSEEDEGDHEAYYEAPRRSAARWIVPASVAGLVLVAGVSAYVWFAGGPSGMGGNAAPVVIAADTDAIKMVPENPGGKTVPNQDKAVYDRVAGGALNDPKQSALISSDEQPMDVVQKTLMPDNLPMEGEEDGADVAATNVGDTQDPRLLPHQAAASGQQAGDQLAVMPRRVKTMIVRPDGTLVEQVTDVPAQGKAPAETAARPVRAETVAASGGARTEPASAAGIAPISQPQGTKPTELADVDVEQTAALTGTQAAVDAAATAPQFAAPVPTARPSRQPTNAVATTTEAAARPIQASAPVSAPSASSGAGGYYIQVASLPSEADAQKSYANIASKFAGVIGGRAHDIARADVAGKGTFYRVRIAAGSTKDEAAALCERYRAAGGTCLIAR